MLLSDNEKKQLWLDLYKIFMKHLLEEEKKERDEKRGLIDIMRDAKFLADEGVVQAMS